MDDVDITSEREEKELAARIAQARRPVPPQERPALGCWSCMGTTQEAAKAKCNYYGECLADWEKRVKYVVS